MPNRCGCANACSCLVVAGDGISVEGIGTLENPYEITSESSDLVGRVEFTDDGNVDFTTTGVGTINDPLTVFADAVLAMSDLTDVPETEPADDGDILVWRIDGWVYEQPAVVGPTLPPGGTDGQVLTKQSSADGDADWETFSGGGGGGGGEVVLEPSIIAAYYRLAPMTGIGATSTPILWDTADTVAEGITYTQATGTFMVLTSGWYLITTRVRVTAASATPYQLRLINTSTGGFIDFMADSAGPGTQAGSLSKQVYLAAGTGFQVHLSGSTVPVDLSVTGNRANAVEVSRLDRGVVGSSAPGKTVLEPTYAAARNNASAQSIPTGGSPTIITFDTENYTEGIPWVSGNQFTIPVDGYYQVDTGITFGTNVTGARVVYIYLNSTPVTQAFFAQSSRESSAVASTTIKAKAGDYITIRAYQNSGVALTLTTAATQNWVTVAKVPSLAPGGGGVVVERPVSVSRQGGNQFIPNAVNTTVDWTTENYTEGDITYSGGGIFTIGSAGYYQVNAKVGYGNNNAGVRQLTLVVNGSNVVPGLINIPTTPSGTNGTGVMLSRMLKLNAGDTVSINTYQNSGAQVGLASAAWNSIDITKVPAAYAGSAVSTYGERNYATERRQSTNVSLPNGTQVKVPWDNAISDDGSIPFADGVWTIPVTGWYKIEVAALFAASATGNRQIRLLINAATSAVTAVPASSGTETPVVLLAKSMLLTAGDTVQTNLQQSSGTTMISSGSGQYNWVSITKVPAPVINGAAASGVWGVGPLAGLGTDSLIGREVYIDAKGQLRSAPLPAQPVLGIPVNCAAEVKFCTDASSTPNAGSSFNAARYTKIGKTVTYWGSGTMGTGAVANGALFLPPSAGVPAYAHYLTPPGVYVSGGTDPMARSQMVGVLDRVVFVATTTSAYHDFPANSFLVWNWTYEVL